MKKLTLLLSLVPALALSAPVIAHDHGAKSEREGKCAKYGKRYSKAGMMPRYLRSVELSEAQQSDIEALVKNHREQRRAEMQDQRSHWQAFRQLSFADELDQARLDQLAEQAAERFKQHSKQRVELNQAIFQTLTDEQQAAVLQKMADYQDKRAARKQH